MRIEISHHIIGFPNYQITREGRVKNIKTNRYLKQNINGCGYFQVNLYNNGRNPRRIHRLIAKAFIPNPDNLPEVDHINRIRTDNRIENLRWATRNQNSKNKGIYISNKLGEKYIHYHLPDKRYRLEISQHNIYKYFGTLQEAIDYRDSLKDELNLIY